MANDQTTEDVATVAGESNQFALDLYSRLAAKPGNLFFSPYSIDSALAMTYAGARGQTAAQMAQVLHLSLPADRLHAAMGSFITQLNADGKGAYELAVANALWAQSGLAYNPQFLQLLSADYGAELRQSDFVHAAEPARLEINGWVGQKTHDKIKELIAPGVLNPLTRLVLVNAIYFKGTWMDPFQKQATQDQPFHLDPNYTATVPLMYQRRHYPAMENDDLQAVELPYAGDDISMVVLLPRKVDGLTDLEQKLTVATLNRWLSQLSTYQTQLYLPKFKMETKFELADVLRSMGMQDAFNDRADFSGILASEQLSISNVIHKAFVDVNEQGTEAAAATAVVMRSLAVRVEKQILFRADHPFIFLIRQNSSGAILFIGRVTDPRT